MKPFNEILRTSSFNVQDFESHRLQLLAERKQKSQKGAMIGGGILVLGAIVSYLFYNGAFLIAGFIVGLIVFFIVRGNTRKKHMQYVKSQIIKNLLEKISPDFIYDPFYGVSEQTFKESGFVKGYSTFSGEDRVTGKVDNTTFEMSQLLIQQKNDKNTVTIFNGIFYKMQSPVTFAGKTNILPDTAEKLFGSLGTIFQKMNMLRDKVVKIDDAAFEKQYVVYSNDENEARNILSPQVIAFLMEKRNTCKNVYMSCIGDKIYFALDNRTDIFPVNINKTIDTATLESYYNELMAQTKIVQDVVNLFKNGGNTGFTNRFN